MTSRVCGGAAESWRGQIGESQRGRVVDGFYSI